MNYLVLARKWRPKSFSEVSGQDHVVKAIQNSLKQNKVHHALLFTGTRGVGKTTIARLFAKSLNCDTGITPEPCGKCESCVSIDEGNFMDLIEVDAASQRGIDDTRDLLENTQYTPTVGRYKVYLIDEVHQLTKEAFNALLKTLEEPPEHMKFLLATTESEKIPITVLSRCLKFNLKKISEEQITQRMKEILDAEKIKYEEGALSIISKSADGSMRDALSLLDQALAYEDYELSENNVIDMLGLIDNKYALSIVQSILNQDSELLKEQLDGLDSKYPNYNDVLDNIASIAQEIAYLQVLDASKVDVQDEIIELSNNHSPELIQLIYQIAINSKKDLSLAPSAREGFTMAILRMFAFQLSDEQSVENRAPDTAQKKIKKSEPLANGNSETSIISSKNWTNEVSKMSIRGAVKQLASNCFFDRIDNNILYLKIHSQNEHQMIDRAVDDLNSFLINQYEEVNKVIIQIEEENGKTLAGEEKIKNEEQIIMNESRASSDPLVQEYVDLFDATIEETK